MLRDGRLVGSGAVAETTIDGIIRLMVGREVNALFAHRETATPGEVALAVEGLTRRGNAQDPHATVLDDVSLSVRRGEILGIAGLVGAGRTEMARADLRRRSVRCRPRSSIDGKPVAIRSPRDAIRHGIGLVPEDRKQQALFLALAVRTNLSMAALDRICSAGHASSTSAPSAPWSRSTASAQHPHGRPGPARRPICPAATSRRSCSPAGWRSRPKVLIVDEPTRGIDVGAKVEVHNLLFEMARSGIAIIAISSELPEVLAISDRIVTMREGRVTGEISARRGEPRRS